MWMSCQQEKMSNAGTETLGEKPLTIIAVQERSQADADSPTRTTLVDGSAVHWLKGDALSVFSAVKTARFVAQESG